MIVAFYGIYVLVTPANWSWLWFLIALLMSFWQWIRRPITEEAIREAMSRIDDDEPRFRGPY